MILSKIVFRGTRPKHLNRIIVELRQDNSQFTVVSCDDVFPFPVTTVRYSGESLLDAETAFLFGFQMLVSEEYAIDAKDNQSKDAVFLALHKTIEVLYMKVLNSLGYNVKGIWKTQSFFSRKSDDNEVDRIGLFTAKHGGRKQWMK